ncbi:uncharacterized protein LOC106055655 [Biomphalaria glabrata]|uniref:Uncharacterized protein LOC106055655 n=1 Tax=Biomphalaria glabrata TaxID=6526 RepID=A0A9U8DZN0_BIOGL|nr:uncharacterized protein LOC106055655 [Biomphalaria glabrata]
MATAATSTSTSLPIPYSSLTTSAVKLKPPITSEPHPRTTAASLSASMSSESTPAPTTSVKRTYVQSEGSSISTALGSKNKKAKTTATPPCHLYRIVKGSSKTEIECVDFSFDICDFMSRLALFPTEILYDGLSQDVPDSPDNGDDVNDFPAITDSTGNRDFEAD